MNKNIFRAYDIRGIAPDDLNPETMHRIGRACAQYVREMYDARTMVIGRDGRVSGKELQKAFMEGAQETGIKIIDVGMATSPMVYWAGCFYGYDSGAVITASHNPKEYNGVKLFGPRAHSICGGELQKILHRCETKNKDAKQSVLSLRAPKARSNPIFEEYKKDLIEKITPGGNLKIVIDAGNGIAGPFAPELLRAAGHEVIELYTDVDGNFPNHVANPEEEANLRDLQKAVIENKADIGIGFDGDGDRIGIIDEKGAFYSADYLLILLARDLLARNPRNKTEKIIFDIKTSKIAENEIKRLGGIPIRHKTGHSFTETKMREEGALLAGECSGHMFLAENYYGFDDAMFAALKICKILTESKKPFSEHFKNLPKLYTTPEIKVPCPDDAKFRVVDALVEEFQKNRAHGALQTKNVLTIDGAFVEFSDTDWGAVRASNTTPCLTLRFEAETREKLEQIKKFFAEKMSAHPEIQRWKFNVGITTE